MRNSQLVKELSKLPALKRELAATRRTASSAIKTAARLEDQIRELSTVDEVRDGLTLTRLGGFIAAAGDDNTRCANIYLNAHNKKTWGLHTYTDSFGRAGERWHGADFPSEAAAEAVALDWIVRGQRPK